MAHRITAFGELLWDLLPTGRTLGGAPFNFIFRAASLGARAVMVSRIGGDELGRQARAVLRRMGMEDGCIQWDARRPTGTVPITFDAHGVADITINPDVAYDYIETAPAAVEAFASADCVCFGTLAQRAPESRATLRTLLRSFRGSLRLLDLNLRKDCWSPAVVRASIECADVLKLNDEEAATVGGLYGLGGLRLDEAARRLAGTGALRHVVVTLGGGGALAVPRDGPAVYAPSHAVTVTDTLGCGDAFSAGFVHGLLDGWPLERAVRYGNAAGAVVARQRGATGPMERADVDRMAAKGVTAPPDPRFS